MLWTCTCSLTLGRCDDSDQTTPIRYLLSFISLQPAIDLCYIGKSMSATLETTTRRVSASPLTPAAFAPFGQVIQNPAKHNAQPALKTVEANQGTATKWLDITQMENFYPLASSGQQAKCVMNMFVCRPRQLEGGRLFTVEILERHPYTPQTFVPLGLDRGNRETCFLVIVAPTLATGQDAAESTASSDTSRPRGPGQPDMAHLQAFIARGDQSVTYGAGTWHAPMVVLGESGVEFVVVQYANGVAEEDCQETEMLINDGGQGLVVDVGSSEGRSKL